MAAPSPTARQTPGGIKLKNGHPTKITCALDPDISFWEKQVTPPGYDWGDPVDQTTMFNTDYVTLDEPELATLTAVSLVAAYDPAVVTQILAIGGINTTWTITHPDGTTEAFYGILKSFMPNQRQRNQQPDANIEIVPTNFDPSAKVEAGPAIASVAGT